MHYRNLNIIGTSHIAQESLDEIAQFISTHKPDFVAVELDRQRLHSLISQEKRKLSLSDIFRIGLKGYIFVVLGGWLQKKLGVIAGVVPGSEMKLAVDLAKIGGAKTILIDQNIELTLKKFSKQITWREKFRFVGDIIRALIFRERELKKLGVNINTFDLKKVPSNDLIKKLMKQMKLRYPNVYDVLVEQRNQVMANRLLKLMKQNEDKFILAVVGAGHEEGMIRIIKKKYNFIEMISKV